MSFYNKINYNIISFPELSLNYWAIPKAYNTSIKFSLFQAIGRDLSTIKEEQIHSVDLNRYIDKPTAYSNGFINFSCVRHPYDRVLSLYKDFGLSGRGQLGKLKGGESLTEFIEKTMNSTDSDNIHLRSQTYFLYDILNNPWFPNIFKTSEVWIFLSKFGIKESFLNKSASKEIKLNKYEKTLIFDRYVTDFKNFNFTY